MATHQSEQQKETVERVMHEFRHGELETSRGRKVKNSKQAIAIGLHEAGASKYESEEKTAKIYGKPRLANDTGRPGRPAASGGAAGNRPGLSCTRRQSVETSPGVRR
jgi:hypothetical protein